MSEQITYYKKHVFVCENYRADGTACCMARANDILDGSVRTLRRFLQEKEMHGKGRIRVNRAGCFNRCAQGPVLVIYPDSVWYRYSSEQDLYRIVNEHLLADRIVADLQLSDC